LRTHFLDGRLRVVLSSFDPLVQEWFERLGPPTEPQLRGWPVIRAGEDVLISAPTGSGKTLAAFLICIDGLIRRARTGELPDNTEVVYCSPLKALSNDVQKNLERPLAEIRALAEKRGIALAPIRVGLRTGDTKASDRQRMLRERPHILVTTPESLYILLTAEKPREMLAAVRTVIVDEIHAVADDKRGSHLSLTLARLDRLAGRPQRIGSVCDRRLGEVERRMQLRERLIDRDRAGLLKLFRRDDVDGCRAGELGLVGARCAENRHRLDLRFPIGRFLCVQWGDGSGAKNCAHGCLH